jgi:aspartate kinase
MKVMKFGGACLASEVLLHRVVAVVREEEDDKVVVVSAVAGVTDKLLGFLEEQHGEAEIDEFIAQLRSLHLGLLPREGLDAAVAEAAIGERLRKLERLLYGVSYTEEVTPRTRDLVLSFGERLSAAMLVARLRPQGVPAEAVEAEAAGIVTDEHHGNASALLKECAKRIPAALGPKLAAGVTPVVTGFFGVNPEGHVTILGRGGSDYSATVLGYALGASAVEIWKEVDGFMTADPKMVPSAAAIGKLSYDEATELAYFGARVLHPRAVQPARLKEMRIYIRNLHSPRDPGTEVGPDSVEHSAVIKSVSYSRDLVTLKLYGADAGYKRGTLGDITSRLGTSGVNVYSATTSQTCIALLIERDDVPRAQRALQPLIGNGAAMDRIEVLPSTALLCTVGEGLGYRKGVAARVFKAMAEAGINVQLISAGASMVALHFTVDAGDLDRAVQAVHDEFFGGRP